MSDETIRDADSRSPDNAEEVGRLRAEVARLEEDKAELLEDHRYILAILDSMPAPTLGGWNWPIIADRFRKTIAKHG